MQPAGLGGATLCVNDEPARSGATAQHAQCSALPLHAPRVVQATRTASRTPSPAWRASRCAKVSGFGVLPRAGHPGKQALACCAVPAPVGRGTHGMLAGLCENFTALLPTPCPSPRRCQRDPGKSSSSSSTQCTNRLAAVAAADVHACGSVHGRRLSVAGAAGPALG